MQVTFSADQVHAFREVAELVLWPFAGWIGRGALHKLRTIQREDVKREIELSRIELKRYIDHKFKECAEGNGCANYKRGGTISYDLRTREDS